MTGEIGEKPACVKTHVRNVVIIPEMVGSVVGIYNGKGIHLKICNDDFWFSVIEIGASSHGQTIRKYSKNRKLTEKQS